MSIFEKVKNNQTKNFYSFIENINEDDINNLTELIIKYSKSNIYFAGIGKSGNIAIHLADVFKSVGLKSFYLNIMNVTHGDLGCINKDDLILFFSKSGNTKEIMDIVDVFNSYKILICSNNESKISSKVDSTFIVPLEEEGDIHFNLIPSNSITNNVIYFNFVLNLYIEKSNLTLENYRKNHPSGDIGFKTKKVRDFISNDIYICDNINILVRDVINLMKENKMGIVFENKSDDNNFYGILTTKDLVNIISNNEKVFEQPIKNFINRKPITLNNPEELISSILKDLKEYKFFKFIPVLDNNKYIGIIDNSKILKYL